ncbi:hypothetical protein T4E_2449 [Trichinella pseudospiralis]|uniref:Uncharacterized protein n=1 Tax=Trichinella pseudospiralis TaxID=6337 RepID=A0A0V0XEQ3_TRIPS|nr:hypothetical protein T4E_2449 [Trichinella pseudospiralis]
MAARGQHVCSGAGKKWHWSCQYTGSAILKSKQRTGENTHRIKGGVVLHSARSVSYTHLDVYKRQP